MTLLPKVLPTAAFLFYCFSTCAQQISGVVRDSSGVAIAYASVVATSCRDELVLAYTTTSDNGAFQLTVQTDCDSIALTARSLGYRTANLTLSIAAIPPKVDFALAASVLQEVVIRAKAIPIVVRKDTTTFNASSFSDSTEFSVEDLLKKLPGVQVSENGQISYNGKTIERVLIEGDDLFSQNYQIATKNVRADMISTVQVIDRYEDNPVLHSIRTTDRMVMNLKIKPERKRTFSGSVTGGVGYGSDWKIRGHTNLFSLSRKDKAYFIGTGNNTGKTAAQSLGLSTGGYFEPDKQGLQSNPLQTLELVQVAPLEKVGLPGEYTTSNRSGMMYFGEVIPFTPQCKLKLSAWAGKDQLQQVSTSATRILLEPNVLDIVELEQTAQRLISRVLQTEFDFFSPNKSHAIRSFIKFSDLPVGGNFQMLRSQTGVPDTWVTNLQDHKTKELFASLEYTYKLNVKTALQLVGKSAWHKGAALLNPNYNGFPAYFGLDSAFTNLHQNVGLRQNATLIFARLFSNFRNVQWTAETGVMGYSGKIESDISLKNPYGTTILIDQMAYRNDFQLLAPQYFANLLLTGEFGNWRVRGQLYERLQTLRVTTADITTATTRQFVTEPSLYLYYKFNEKASLGANYKYQQTPPGMTTMAPAFVFTNYQSLQRGLPDIALLPGNAVGVNYAFNDRQNQFSWNIGAHFKHNKNQFGGRYQINPVLLLQEKFRPVDNTTYILNTTMSRFLRSINCRFELGARIFQFQETAFVNSDVPRKLNTTVQHVNFSFGTAFDSWVNVILESSGSFSALNNTPNLAPLRTTNLFSTFQIKVRPSKKFDLKIFARHAANQPDKNKPYRHFWATDGVAHFRFPAWRSNLDVSALNLLGVRKFEQVFADGFYQSTVGVQAVSPFFVVSWDYNF